ncbi:SET domain protein [Aspergillus lucknowensis]|uniref:SET domain-containing protein n=1 Tax=Aspergillus lucknowensis TaxID=176173 RepID=A0ABR4LR43_9EURO
MALGCAPDLASQRPADESRLEVYSTLLQWMRAHGGDLDENVYISHDSQRGTHIRVKREGVPSNAHIIKTPIATTLSYFNAIDHRSGETNFPAHGINLPREFIDSVGPEEASIFFLVGQFLRGSESFWYPYLQSLPQPGSLTTLPYYEEDEDLEWLEGTSLIQARTQKIAQLRDKYETSSSELSKSKFRDAGKYSWDLYVWASTIFVSRAFSAKVLSGVVPDLGVPEENISVLLPFIDILNHRPLAKVEWRAGTESVDFVVLEEVGADQEIANNYGPRNNEQLMMNYGFCLSDNPCDYRTVGLRAPPGSPLQIARERQQELFPDSNKDTEGPYYVFNIFYPLLAPDIPMEHSIFSPALFNAVSILAANQRELETLEISGHEIRIPNAYGNSRAIVAALSQIIIELITHIVRLRSSRPRAKQPGNLKQIHAETYRNSQVRLSESALVIAAWTLQRAQLHGLKGGWDETKRLLAEHMACLPKGKFSEAVESRIQVRILERPSVLAKTGELFAPHDLLHLLPVEVQKHFQECLSAVLKTTSRNMSALRGITQRAYPFQFPLFACFVVAVHIKYSHNPPGEGENFLPARLSRWASLILDHYQTPTDDVAWALEDEDDEALLSEFDEVVETMREHNATVFSNLEAFTGGWQGDAWWLSGNWVRWAWMVTEQEGVQTPEDPLALLSSNKSENITLSTAAYLYIPQE